MQNGSWPIYSNTIVARDFYFTINIKWFTFKSFWSKI